MFGLWQRLLPIQRLSLLSILFFLAALPLAIWLAVNPTNPFSKAGGGTPGQTIPIPITTGFNLFGPSTERGSNYYAEVFLQDLNSQFVSKNIPGKNTPSGNKITTIYKYDTNSDTGSANWKIHTLGRTNDDNFRVVNGEAYFVTSTWPGSGKLDRKQTTAFLPLSVPVNEKWSLISFTRLPCDSSLCENGGNTAEGVLQLAKQQGIAVEALVQFKGGRYVIHSIGSDLNNFPILPGEGYWIYNSGEGKQFLWPQPQPTSTDCGVYTYQDKYYDGVGKHCMDKIIIKGVYFVAKNQTSGIKLYWQDNMLDIFTQMKIFYEREFNNKIQITIDTPIIVNGDNNIEDYNQFAIEREIRDKVAIEEADSFVVLMFYPIQTENDKRVQGNWGGGGEVGNSSSAMNSWFWLDPEQLGTVTTKVGTNYSGYLGSAHEFGHALGMRHPWEEEDNRDADGNILDPNYGNFEEGSIMSYAGQKGPLVQNSIVRTQTKEKMIVQ